MGFYAPAQIVRDARNHGVCVLPLDVNYSGYDCTLEKREETTTRLSAPSSHDPTTWGAHGPALRLGLRLVRGLSATTARGIEAAGRNGPITSIRTLARRDDVTRETLARLAAADFFRSLGLDRREALWEILAVDDEHGLFEDLEPDEPRPVLPPTDLSERVVRDYDTIGLSLEAHPISLLRRELAVGLLNGQGVPVGEGVLAILIHNLLRKRTPDQ